MIICEFTNQNRSLGFGLGSIKGELSHQLWNNLHLCVSLILKDSRNKECIGNRTNYKSKEIGRDIVCIREQIRLLWLISLTPFSVCPTQVCISIIPVIDIGILKVRVLSILPGTENISIPHRIPFTYNIRCLIHQAGRVPTVIGDISIYSKDTCQVIIVIFLVVYNSHNISTTYFVVFCCLSNTLYGL